MVHRPKSQINFDLVNVNADLSEPNSRQETSLNRKQAELKPNQYPGSRLHHRAGIRFTPFAD
jgi:hypothetical protein